MDADVCNTCLQLLNPKNDADTSTPSLNSVEIHMRFAISFAINPNHSISWQTYNNDDDDIEKYRSFANSRGNSRKFEAMMFFHKLV